MISIFLKQHVCEDKSAVSSILEVSKISFRHGLRVKAAFGTAAYSF